VAPVDPPFDWPKNIPMRWSWVSINPGTA